MFARGQLLMIEMPEAEGAAFFIVGQKLPKMLQEGESHSEMTELEAKLRPAKNPNYSQGKGRHDMLTHSKMNR